MANLWGWQDTVKPARWIPEEVSELRRALVSRAITDIGVCENPPGSNRSPYIDKILRAAYVPESLITTGKGWWCAAWTGWMRRELGLSVPKDYGATRSWGMWPDYPLTDTAEVGDMVLYGGPDLTGPIVYNGQRWHSSHIGIVIRTDPYLMSVEGNAAFGAHSANGEAVVSRKVELPRIIGFVPAE